MARNAWRIARRNGWWIPVLILACTWATVAAPGSPAVPRGGREEVEVRLLQVPFVVVDPRKGDGGSVRGIRLEDLRVRIDGREVPAEERADFRLDEVCGPDAMPPVREGEPSGRLVVLVADFNYLDTRGRELVAKAIEALADRLERRGAGSFRYKVYGITREVVPFTPGATRDPDDLRAAARLVRLAAWSEGPGTTEGPDLAAEIQFLARGPVREFRRWAARVESRFAPRGPAAWRRPQDLSDEEKQDPQLQLEIESRIQAEARMRQVDGQRALAGNDANSLAEFARGEVDRAQSGMFDAMADARQRHRPAASLAALRAILLANGDWPGWKGLVLYTSEGFRYADEQRQRMLMEQVLDAARGDFVLWTVDVAGLARPPGSGEETSLGLLPSSLLSPLARETGGEVLRRTGDLSLAWKGLEERLSCYYLLSIPVPAGAAGRSLAVDVRLDTSRRRELWGLRVEQSGKVLVEGPRARLLRRRVAALLNPADFPRPPVTVEAGPATGDGLPVRVRVPLGGLTWEPFPGEQGGVLARLLVDAVVERVGTLGNRIACRLDAGREGRLVAWLPRPPRKQDRRELLLDVPCRVPGPGSYRLRAAVTDLVAGEVGGGIGLALLPDRDRADRGIVLEAAAPRDLSWRPGDRAARPSRDAPAWRLVAGGERVSAGDRLRVTWRSCGGRHSPARAAVLREAGSGEAPEVVLVVPPGQVREEQGVPCALHRFELPGYSLPPGPLVLALLAPETDPAEWGAAWRPGKPLPPGTIGAIRLVVEP